MKKLLVGALLLAMFGGEKELPAPKKKRRKKKQKALPPKKKPLCGEEGLHDARCFEPQALRDCEVPPELMRAPITDGEYPATMKYVGISLTRVSIFKTTGNNGKWIFAQSMYPSSLEGENVTVYERQPDGYYRKMDAQPQQKDTWLVGCPWWVEKRDENLCRCKGCGVYFQAGHDLNKVPHRPGCDTQAPYSAPSSPLKKAVKKLADEGKVEVKKVGPYNYYYPRGYDGEALK